MDQYYTSPDYAVHCMKIVNDKLNTEGMHYFEPCVGTGSFFNLMPEQYRSGYDIYPRVPGIKVRNFLIQRDLMNNNLPVLVVSNPPFGTRATQAVKFFNKCASFTDVQYICFIVPLTFRKPATQNKLNQYFHLVHDEASPHKCFIIDGKAHHVPCCFQIWERKEQPRVLHIINNESQHFTFCKKEEADISIKRVGTKAGEVAEAGQEHKEPSMLYIKSTHTDKIKLIMKSREYLDDIHQIRKTTAGVYCVSKSELVCTISRYI